MLPTQGGSYFQCHMIQPRKYSASHSTMSLHIRSQEPTISTTGAASDLIETKHFRMQESAAEFL